MHNRKRTSTIMSASNGDASTSGGEDGALREALQSRPNPPSKRSRHGTLKPSDGGKPTGKSGKAKLVGKVKTSLVAPEASSLPPEIWRLIGQKILQIQTLKSLVRVSRAFCNIFTPILCARRIVNLEKFSEPLDETPLPPNLHYVQDFRINLYEFRFRVEGYHPYMAAPYASWIARALKGMKCLRSFSWRNESFEDGFTPDLILRDANLLHVLKGTETLKHVSIQFGAQFVDDSVAVCNCYFPLKGFRNLTSLELYEFYGDHGSVVKDLASCLCDSPTLKKLGIAFACEIMEDDDEAILFGGPHHETDFLERLCNYYGSICEKGPLALETLRLGHGIYLEQPSTLMDSHYLAKLVDVRSLHVLHIYNGLVKNELDASESCYRPVDWTPFALEQCKSLRQLSVHRLEEDVTCWLNQESNPVQELIVGDHYYLYDQGWREFSKLRHSQLSMLWIREKFPPPSAWVESDWSDTDSSVSDWTDVDSETSDESETYAINGEVPSIRLTQGEFSRLSAPKLDRRVMTVLDRLPDGGSNLTRLCIALDFEAQWASKIIKKSIFPKLTKVLQRHFSEQLGKLSRLTQLRINAKSWRGGGYPTLASSIWPDTNHDTENIEIARRFALLICTICPSLQYIMIGHDLACEVIRPIADHKGMRTRSKSAIRLRNLDRDEELGIELFAMSDFTEQGGLPGWKRDAPEEDRGTVRTTREINDLLIAQGISPLPL